uniref:Serine/threonine protein kinase n=1 Tax=uncultured bacterium Contigcl_23 TaxID=1393667 RepID=W0FRE8_9BACT|nr:serine/threonine protein kinase [uncultured bacterium Contigcl_23]
MKKLIAMAVLAAVLLTGAAGAENAEAGLFMQIRGLLFEFCSGVGAWGTELVMGENGAFTGSFHDSEMGETGEGYPNGTVYVCTFHGRFSDPAAIDEYSWLVQMDAEPDGGQVPEAIEDGIRYVTTEPYGVEKAKTVIIFLPGTPVDRLPEGFMIWSHLQEMDPEATEIPYYAIWNEDDEAGFVSDSAYQDY